MKSFLLVKDGGLPVRLIVRSTRRVFGPRYHFTANQYFTLLTVALIRSADDTADGEGNKSCNLLHRDCTGEGHGCENHHHGVPVVRETDRDGTETEAI